MSEETTREEAKEVPTGMVVFEFIKNHGTRKKGETVEPMPRSTADALVEHKVGKITKVLKRVEKVDKQ